MGKILWITYDWSSDLGGKGRVTTAWINALRACGHGVTLLDLEIGGRDPGATVARRGLDPDASLEVRFVKRLSRVAPTVVAFFKTRSFDAVILGAAPNIDMVVFALIKVLRLAPGTTILRVEHTNTFEYLRRSRYRVPYGLVSKMLWRRFDAMIVPTNGIKRLFAERYGVPSARLMKVHWPVVGEEIEALAVKPVEEEIFAPDRKHKILISIMRFSRQDKDFGTILRAFRIISAKTQAVLVLLGQGDSAYVEKTTDELGLEGKVHVLGFRKNPFSYLAKSDAFLFASRYEGFPLILPEAMASGCPVIATDTDFGPGEAIVDGESGFLVPVGDYDAMAERALRILENDDLRKQFVENGKQRARNWRIDASSREFTDYVAHTLYR